FGDIDAMSRGSAVLEGRHRPGPDVTAHIQNPYTRPQVSQQALPVGGLIVEPAGLLAARERCHEAQAGFGDLDLLGNLTEGRLRVRRQVLERTRAGVVLPEEGRWL